MRITTHNGRFIWIDLGLKTLATLSNGEEFENQAHLSSEPANDRMSCIRCPRMWH